MKTSYVQSSEPFLESEDEGQIKKKELTIFS